MKKSCYILDVYPSGENERSELIQNLKNIKKEGSDILLTSHSTCDPEIINLVDYFIYEKENTYYYLDSDILNHIKNWDQLNPIFMETITTNDNIFINKLVITGYSVVITSQLINSIKFLYSKGYDFAFYFVGDFLFPIDGLRHKTDAIIERLEKTNKRNYFVKNSSIFNGWFAPFFFGFSIDNELVQKLPTCDISLNSNFQSYFPNCCFEDVILKLWEKENNIVEDHQSLDLIFGKDRWDIKRSFIKSGQSSLCYFAPCSIYFGLNEDFILPMLFLNLQWNGPHEKVSFDVEILNTSTKEILYSKSAILEKGFFYQQDLTSFVQGNTYITMKKKVADLSSGISFDEEIILDLLRYKEYSVLKGFKKIT
jgi:hypothetical protein